MIKKRIGLDVDDTICNTRFVLMKYAYKYNEEHGNKPLLKYNATYYSEIFGWTEEEIDDFFKTYYLIALEEIEPKFHAKEVITKLKEEGYEIVYITIRSDKFCGGEGEAKRILEEWLNKYEIPYDEIHTGIHDKKTFCEEHNINIFMDDTVKIINSMKETDIRTFISMNDYNMDFKDSNITNIYSMDEFYNKVHESE